MSTFSDVPDAAEAAVIVNGGIGQYGVGDRVPLDFAHENDGIMETCAVYVDDEGTPLNTTRHFNGPNAGRTLSPSGSDGGDDSGDADDVLTEEEVAQLQDEHGVSREEVAEAAEKQGLKMPNDDGGLSGALAERAADASTPATETTTSGSTSNSSGSRTSDADGPPDAAGFMLIEGTVFDDKGHANSDRMAQHAEANDTLFYKSGDKVPEEVVAEKWDELSGRVLPLNADGEPVNGFEDRARGKDADLLHYRNRWT